MFDVRLGRPVALAGPVDIGPPPGGRAGFANAVINWVRLGVTSVRTYRNPGRLWPERAHVQPRPLTDDPPM